MKQKRSEFRIKILFNILLDICFCMLIEFGALAPILEHFTLCFCH